MSWHPGQTGRYHPAEPSSTAGLQRSEEDVLIHRCVSISPAVCIVVLFTIALALLLSGCSAPTAKAPPTTTFVSKRYGYSIALPGHSARWYNRPALANWTSGSIGGIDSPGFDTFTDLKLSRNYLLAAVPGRWSLSRWTDFAMSARSEICGLPRSLPSSTLDGARARVFTWSCTDGYRIIGATALHAGRGYFMLVISPIADSRSADLDAFQATRRSFRFRHV